MVQARRLAFTLNGHSLTSGVLSRIDLQMYCCQVIIFKIYFFGDMFNQYCTHQFWLNLISRRTVLVEEVHEFSVGEENKTIQKDSNQAFTMIDRTGRAFQRVFVNSLTHVLCCHTIWATPA